MARCAMTSHPPYTFHLTVAIKRSEDFAKFIFFAAPKIQGNHAPSFGCPFSAQLAPLLAFHFPWIYQ
jgi:hypothetical protein